MTPSAPTIRMRAAGLAIGGMLALAPSAHAQTRGTTMDDETKATAEVVEAFAQAQRGGDTDALLALFAPDAQWRVEGAPDVPWVGDHRGPEAIGAFLRTFAANLEVVSSETLDERITGDSAFQVNRMVLRVRGTGREVTSHTVVHFQVEDGRITKHNVYENSYDVAVAWRDAPRSHLASQRGEPLFVEGEGPTEPRLPLPKVSEMAPEVRERLEGMETVLNVFRAAALSPDTFAPVMDLAGAALTKMEIERSLKELAFLRTAYLSGAQYEWTQHVPLAKEAGLSDAQIDALNRGLAGEDLFDDRERLVVQFTDELILGVHVSEPTFERMREAFPPRQIAELIFSIGNYMMQSRAMVALELPIDAATGTGWAN